MDKIKENLGAMIVLAVVAVVAGLFFGFGFKTFNSPINQLSGYTGNFDTYAAGFTVSTSTVNTTSTQIVASSTILTTLVNNSTSTFTCKPDDRGTTAASSTVATGLGYTVGPQGSTGPNIPSEISFGACQPGMYNCFPFTGTLNCVADVAATVTKISH